MNEKGSNHQLLKRNNYNLIKKYIYRHSPISRVEVAQALSLTTPTITGMVTPLLNRGLLREVEAKIRAAGYRVGNVDVTVIAQKPKLKDHIPTMMQNIADDLQVDLSQVNVKATTEERLGFTGREEGLACHAVCLLEE
jgi:predicted transcriptional regulator